MAKNRFDPKSLSELAPKWSNKISSYVEKAQDIAALQAPLNKALGPILSKKCRVSNYHNGTLCIEAASATLATRLGYLKMEILSEFRQSGFHDCSQVKITTNPEAQQRLSQRQVRTQPKSEKQHKLSESTAEQLTMLAESAPEGLKEKLLKLARHAKK
ncbi:DUF721 domain-containing protein [Pseudoalteromonas luteoviolacea]|uniref:RNA-binding protein n=1 Tax=Pseudoalteromonas luteoviolacea S4054 TaxID=1129367 RepID=A0A0F6ACR0_9GAMM|nr:DciA family protein [Pseudoalteromonas luteoviolacea]AOT09734.1 RNA-binding protein [Pseudoalteromonas luteoviolacea]AOT14647.1 RNA-binding protein [Pseudoalteromonas luteoviolacea]AOT19561.1 RNA-binding protein [Pseudoalteromonas luteoviolacea]KKE84002.1 hypothetical protein N479_11360 [Pseudoalteromonas luteoviolacea S4054]KZN77396.1 hypothetical protein N481_04900 [Pseudoalteromonas luteoviolacea S4047-1]